MTYVLAYDIGTTGVKTCLCSVEDSIKVLSGKSAEYPLYMVEGGGAEQDGDDWWNAMAKTTREVLNDTGIKPEEIAGISFCSQMQGLVMVDKDGVPVHRPFSYMDQRATEEIKKGIAYGIQIAGANIFKLIPSLIITGAVTSSVKDPVWKYKWLEAHEPENFARAYRWLDVKDYLIARCTGEFTMTQDSAFGTLIYDSRKGKEGWSKKMCDMFDLKMELLPKIIKSTDRVGGLTKRAADELGLKEGTAVFGGGGDSSLIGVGAGTVEIGDTHIYSGTSGWVITVTDKQMVDVTAMMAAAVGAQDGKFNYFAEMETAGKCLAWVKDHLALDEIGIYLEKKDVTELDDVYASLYDYLSAAVKDVPPGSGGVIFTPWLHGNRCPFEDPGVRAGFTGIGIDTGKTELIHAVLEGVAYHLAWMLEIQNHKVPIKDTVRYVGGGAQSDVWCQMIADITGKNIEVVESPQNVGAVGAAAVTAVGLGIIPNLECVKQYVRVEKTFKPDAARHKAYKPYYEKFKKMYDNTKKIYK